MMKGTRSAVAPDRGSRTQAKQFLVMLLLGPPGLGLAFWGFKLLSAKHGFNLPALLLILLGAGMLLIMAVYHYSCDFKGKYSSRARSIAGYIAIVVGGGVVGLVIKTLLFRFFRP